MNFEGSKRRKGWLIPILVVVVPLMFAFAYLLVPIYEWSCAKVGANGKLMTPPVAYNADKVVIDTQRTIKVRFLGDVKANVPWTFTPEHPEMHIHPGQLVEGKFNAENIGHYPVTTRVVVNTIPAHAVKYVHEVASCFCLKKHSLLPHERVSLPVGFYIDRELPKEITEVIMSYSLFKTSDEVAIPTKPTHQHHPTHHHAGTAHHEHIA